jgi:hypothetical protein
MEEYFLGPKKGQTCLAPDEALVRLTHAFRWVSASRELATSPAGQAEAALRSLGATPAMLAEWRRRHAPGASILVVVTDVDHGEGDTFLRFIVGPESGITVGFESERHFKAARKLVKKLAQALGYRHGRA